MRSLAAVVAILLLASSAIASEKSRFQSTAAHCTAAHEQCVTVTAQAAECSNKDKCFVFDPSFDHHRRSTSAVLEVEEKHGKDIIAEAASSLADIFSSSDNDIDGHDDSDNNDNDNDRLTKALSVPSMASDVAPIRMMDEVAHKFEGKVELMKDSSAAATRRNAR